MGIVALSAGQVHATNPSLAAVTVTTLARGPVKALPTGKFFVSNLEFRQLPGSDFGPHKHIAAIVYTLHGTSTISIAGGADQSVGAGEAAFIPAQVMHTHQNLAGRIGAGAIAAGIIILAVLLCAATWLRGSRRRVTVAGLSVLLIGAGALPLVGATSDDYYLLAVRPEAQRVQPMPRPDGRVVFSSPVVDPVPTGPYVETLSAVSVAAGARYDSPVTLGPQMIVILGGAAAVSVGDQTAQLGTGDSTLAQSGQALSILNSGTNTLQLLDFAVTSA
ncbi:MAG: cupin domain-containing protein [Candidatus Dormibacterales bacterium]